MRVDRPPPGEELNDGEQTPARLAASVIVLRDAPSGPEVLLVQRNPEARFMGGAWVFPGGAVARGEEPPAAALRETIEEAAIDLRDPATLIPFSRWVTPVDVRVRFDTWFFIASAPAGETGRPDGEECVDLRWLAPAEALAAGERGDLMLVFPTIKHLEQIAVHRSVEAALAAAGDRVVEPVLPRIVARGGAHEVLLPGEAGYES